MIASSKLRINSVFIFGLAILFYFFFMHAKHDSALSAVNPFADDPYDAVGSFAIQAAVFLGILCVIRAFRPNPPAVESIHRESFLLRAQMAGVLSVAVTLATDAVAMLRHPHLWLGLPAGYRLLAWLGGMAVLTAAIGAPVYRMAKKIDLPAAPPQWNRILIVSLVAVGIILHYPESFRRGLIGVLATPLVGTAILFACMWVWTTALVPFQASSAVGTKPPGTRWYARRSFQWASVILAGILIGLFFVAGEASEGTGIPPARLVLVVSAYIGLETAGVMIGYGFLRKPLGLFRRFS
ncbi:MAG TPA: hypothetical protein VJN21_03000 [Candidatus Acidoferrales bacterium]|nr:hypothetical protein [Candidatus Acidoferrales bacterium]